MYPVRPEPTKLILVGTQTTYYAKQRYKAPTIKFSMQYGDCGRGPGYNFLPLSTLTHYFLCGANCAGGSFTVIMTRNPQEVSQFPNLRIVGV